MKNEVNQLKKIEKQLQAAVKMHGQQAKTIGKIIPKLAGKYMEKK
jgi:hypothetical protein|tara:strand:+ start:754 stop:888 length:135 start_codon:yes stop_codon:yes gene_type:complete